MMLRGGGSDDLNEEDDVGDTASTSSWSTVASSVTTVGGANLLLGALASGHSVMTGGSGEAKKPWRQLSAAKKIRSAGIGRNRRKKEKLRRTYARLDRHELE